MMAKPPAILDSPRRQDENGGQSEDRTAKETELDPTTADENTFIDRYGVDLRKPLYPQVAALGDRYFEWVHEPVRKTTLKRLREWDQGRWPGSVRIFASDRLEVMTHISWKLVLALWVPVTVGLLALARGVHGVGWAPLAGLWFGGLVLWTLVEYILHRFFFHTAPKGPAGIKAHFLAHGIHHYDPFDGTRLVFPPLPATGIALVIYGLFELVWPTGIACAVMAGLLTGYLLYDMSHYVSHHGKIRDPWFRFLHRYHAAHHHREPDALFGVSNPFWDLVFRTGSLKF
jgi:dihydroceramide fatty acyl 2-hydroxylase